MINKVLIISDNPYLCKVFNGIISDPIYGLFDFTFAITPFSSLSDFLPLVNIVVDLKSKKDVDQIIASYNVVFSIHCKQIFPSALIKNVRCINVHPGYNPINRGWYPQVFSIINNTPIGVTIHEIDTELDHGNIIVRDFVDKTSFDTSLSLYNKIIAKEIDLLNSNLLSILENKYEAFPPENDGNLYLKKDFNKLCKLDLSEMTTYKLCIDRLRALTHGDFKNCYFIDEQTGKKVYLKIVFEPEV